MATSPGPTEIPLLSPQPDHHPLSLDALPSFPSSTRRSTSFNLRTLAPLRPSPSSDHKYSDFDPRVPQRHHASSLSSRHDRMPTVSDADLLGVGPSQRLLRRTNAALRSSPALSDHPAIDDPIIDLLPPSPSGASRPAFDSLSKEDIAILDTRFDLMSDEELDIYLEHFHLGADLGASTTDLPTPRVLRSVPPNSSSVPSPRQPSPPEDNSDADKSPLFPPSPPSNSTQREVLDHPLRILGRAVRELRETIKRLEVDNALLKEELAAGGGPKTTEMRTKQADEISIHDSLTEALSTSLNSSPPVTVSVAARRTPSSPSPSTTRSMPPRSPASAFSAPFPSSPVDPGPSNQSMHTVDSSTPQSATRRNNRSSWTAGLWAWNEKKTSRTRKGSVGSVMSQSLPVTGGVTPVPESAVVEGEDEESWRTGDGGSAPSFRAIFLSTRIITPDPSSILISPTIPANSLVAYLAHSLVSNARDEGILARDPPGKRRASRETRSRAASIASQDIATIGSGTPPKDMRGQGYGDQALAATASLGRSLLSTVSSATLRGTRVIANITDEGVRPSLLSRASSTRPFPTTAVSATQTIAASGSSSASPMANALPPSVELASIVPDEARPPTAVLSRTNLGSFFQSSKAVPTLRTATRFTSKDPPLTDRYGFIYDIQHARMLKDASAAGTPAPASLNGTLPGTPDEGWIEKRRRNGQDSVRLSGSRSPTPTGHAPSLPRSSFDSAMSQSSISPGIRSDTPDSNTLPISQANESRNRSSTLLNLNPSPARPVAAKDNLTVSTRGATSLQPGVSNASPLSSSLLEPVSTEVGSQTSRLTVSSLLDQLTEIHDQQQKERTAEWDAFLRRRKGRKGHEGRIGGEEMRWAAGLIGISQMGLQKAGAEEWKTFTRLARRGIPLAYRADIWAECSGAKDAMVPGEYAEILAVHANDTSPFLTEIEKDVSRTFPGNVFFGGDGPGVDKLRRVLVAYSWHNPAVGYCQGMNMLAATLLLTHTDEEQAYWVLLSIIENLLPKDFFAPSLLASRADLAVLVDLVKQLVPRVSDHLAELRVELASVTFGWFLSLFTDCLPVETLFRVWDVFFVEGHDTLFRVAIAILKLAEVELCACDSVSDLFAYVGGMTSRLWAADKLIALQHSYKPIIRHADLVARCELKVMQIQNELEGAT